MKIEEQEQFWIDTRLQPEEMDFLWKCISEENNKKKWNNELAGNISKSELIQDKDNWFHENVLQDLTEKLFYQNWDAYLFYPFIVVHNLQLFIMVKVIKLQKNKSIILLIHLASRPI